MLQLLAGAYGDLSLTENSVQVLKYESGIFSGPQAIKVNQCNNDPG